VLLSKRWHTGVVFMQPGVKVNGAYYCDVLLLKKLLPDICQAAGDFCFPAHHACTKAQSCCDTRLRSSHQMWPPNRPDLSSVDYRLLRVIQECLCQKQQGTSNIVDELWLLTEWNIFHKVGQKHPSGEVGNYVAVLLQIYFSICVPKIIKIQCSLTKLLQQYLGAMFCPTV